MQQPSLATQYCAHQVSRDTEKYFPGFITQFKYYLIYVGNIYMWIPNWPWRIWK